MDRVRHLLATTLGKHHTLTQQYQLIPKQAPELQISELPQFKLAIDDLEETCQDVESAFFTLPNHQEFLAAEARMAP